MQSVLVAAGPIFLVNIPWILLLVWYVRKRRSRKGGGQLSFPSRMDFPDRWLGSGPESAPFNGQETEFPEKSRDVKWREE